MPNHCSNTLTYEGKRSQCFDFARDHYRTPEAWDANEASGREKTTLDFSYAVPYPDPNERAPWRKASHSGWYDFHIQHWGTKWNAYDIEPSTFPEVIEGISEDWKNDSASGHYTFTTAWSPPEAWLQAVTKKYPDLVFTLMFEEQGADFCGFIRAQDGSVLEEDQRTCSEFAPDGVDYDDEAQAEAAWEAQSDNIANFFAEISN